MRISDCSSDVCSSDLIEAVSQSEIDRLRATVTAATAALAGADARIAARALDVEFTTVRAPLSGRISDRQIDAGNLVSAGDAGGTLLTTINALDPIYFTFQGSRSEEHPSELQSLMRI